jgi:aspartate carbamoyltransferase catalytic subunit
VHSLCNALSLFDSELFFVSPPSLRVPGHVREELTAAGQAFHETEALEDVLPRLDVLYVTRIQKERFAEQVEYERVRGIYRIDRPLLERCGVKPGLRVMHPLPRVDELAEDVDETEYAAYFEQARNGIPTRQALLAMVLGKA